MWRNRASALLLIVAACGVAHAQNIPAPKLDLIRRTVAAQKLDARIGAFVAQRVEARAEDFRLRNPALSDSLAAEARAVIARVHAENIEGRDGLMARVYAVLDRHLTTEDLKFATDFKDSDQGKRYRELAPRVVAESLEAGRQWSERLEPEIRQRLRESLRGADVRL